jgi:hypothetical protein
MNVRTDRAAAPAEPASSPRPAGRRLLRWIVNLWVVLHFSAILAAAASVGPSSDLVLASWRVFRPYLEILYLNHGYNFYAPEPTPSTLLTFVAERDDGTLVRGRIPDPSLWPRLLYQRHLLLTEHIGIAPPPLHKHWYKSYARHLCHQYAASRIRLTRLTHYPPAMEMVRNGRQLDDPASYEEMDLGVFRCGEL